MTPEDVNRYIGLPWVAGARGPAQFDCWGLLAHVQTRYFGRSMPVLTALGGAAREAHDSRVRSGEWETVDQPFHGAGVLMRGGDDPHVGVWLELQGGGVLHAMERFGVIWTPRSALRLQGFSRLTFYRFHV